MDLPSHFSVLIFYHLTQSPWRKVQELGLTKAYKENIQVKHFCGMLDALAYLPVNEIESGMRYLIRKIPQDDGLEALELLVNYFDATYVSGTIRRVKRPGTGDGIPKLNLRRKPPLFPPPLWNVHEAT